MGKMGTRESRLVKSINSLLRVDGLTLHLKGDLETLKYYVLKSSRKVKGNRRKVMEELDNLIIEIRGIHDEQTNYQSGVGKRYADKLNSTYIKPNSAARLADFQGILAGLSREVQSLLESSEIKRGTVFQNTRFTMPGAKRTSNPAMREAMDAAIAKHNNK